MFTRHVRSQKPQISEAIIIAPVVKVEKTRFMLAVTFHNDRPFPQNLLLFIPRESVKSKKNFLTMEISLLYKSPTGLLFLVKCDDVTPMQFNYSSYMVIQMFKLHLVLVKFWPIV